MKKKIILKLMILAIFLVGCSAEEVLKFEKKDIDKIKYSITPESDKKESVYTEELQINKDLSMIYTVKNNENIEVYLEEGVLGEREMQILLNAIDLKEFFSLKDSKKDKEMKNKYYSYIEIISGNQSHKIGGVTPSNKMYKEVETIIFDIIDYNFKDFTKEID